MRIGLASVDSGDESMLDPSRTPHRTVCGSLIRVCSHQTHRPHQTT